jgi:hypothetical protein
MEITLPFLLDTVITTNDILGKVPKMRYVDHDMHDATKFPKLVKENYLINMTEIGPLGRPMIEPVQWIMRLYNSGIMNLLGIPHFGNGKNVSLCVKQVFTCIHGGILWMKRPMQIDVALISKIIGLSTVGTQTNDYLENKARKKELAEQVKVEFETTPGNKCIVIKDINDNAKWFANKLMECKLLRKCYREESPAV